MTGENVMRIGMGQDVHRLIPERKLILAGVAIPFEKGLFGHSDADVLTHAACDALLGAAGLGDIGLHFPDSDDKYKDISSMLLLEKVHALVRRKGYMIANMDMTLFAQAPRLSPYRDQMMENMARCLGVKKDIINIKFTTTEGLGFVGNGEGMKAVCIVLLNEIQKD